jgi:hypothetical protein
MPLTVEGGPVSRGTRPGNRLGAFCKHVRLLEFSRSQHELARPRVEPFKVRRRVPP